MSEYWGPGEHTSFCLLGEHHYGPCLGDWVCPCGVTLSDHDDWPSCPAFDAEGDEAS